MRLRLATPDDLAQLRAWDAAPHVMAVRGADGPWDWERELGQRPDWRELLIAELDGRPVGFIQIIDPAREETRYWGDCAPDLRAIDIWIGEPDLLGRGHGTAMMRLALARCFADPKVTAVLVDPLAANHRARRFYARQGFVELGPRRFGQDDCIVCRLERAVWEESRDRRA